MGGRFGVDAGGIRGLLNLLADKPQREAVESDLIERGLRLRDVGSGDFTWRDLWVLLDNLPPTSALARAQGFAWTPGDYLLAQGVDFLGWLAWAQTEDGQKNRNRPVPLPRPGDEEPERLGGGGMTVEEANEWLGWAAPEPKDGS